MLRLLFRVRATLYTVPGGDTVQILKTAEALERQGHKVQLDPDGTANPKNFDVVHVFNLMRPQEIWDTVREAGRVGRPVVLSTIYGPYTEYDQIQRRGMGGWLAKVLPTSTFETAKILGRRVVNGESHPRLGQMVMRGYHKAQTDIVAGTTVFLPNSNSEWERVCSDFPLAHGKPSVVVPNAVDHSIFHPNHECPRCEEVRRLYGDGFVLSVARIEGRKCQVELADAMAGLPWKLVLVGKPGPNSRDYFNRLVDASKKSGNCMLVGHVDQGDLPCLYGAARVHALVSWMESTGLSTLEAAAIGCRLVITEKGDTREYFGDLAEYCDPASVPSIRKAICQAYDRPLDQAGLERLRKRCTWEEAARYSVLGYELALTKFGADCRIKSE